MGGYQQKRKRDEVFHVRKSLLFRHMPDIIKGVCLDLLQQCHVVRLFHASLPVGCIYGSGNRSNFLTGVYVAPPAVRCVFFESTVFPTLRHSEDPDLQSQ